MTLATVEACAEKLRQQKFTPAFAESATAGRATAEFAMVEHSGEFLKGGIICYDACVKQDLLNVDEKLIEKYTAESQEVTNAACIGLQTLIEADILIAITGLTCPGGSESEEKPVGTMFISMLKNGQLSGQRYFFEGDKEDIILQTINQVALIISMAL